jgi:hypothetical protein
LSCARRATGRGMRQEAIELPPVPYCEIGVEEWPSQEPNEESRAVRARPMHVRSRCQRCAEQTRGEPKIPNCKDTVPRMVTPGHRSRSRWPPWRRAQWVWRRARGRRARGGRGEPIEGPATEDCVKACMKSHRTIGWSSCTCEVQAVIRGPPLYAVCVFCYL